MTTRTPTVSCSTKWCDTSRKTFGSDDRTEMAAAIRKLDERRVPYRWLELSKYPDGTIFVCEGEKDADRLVSIGHCATTVAAGKWTNECVEALAARDIIILQDNDEAGRVKALAAAQALHGTAKTIRVVLLPDLPDKGDVSDWLDADPSRAEKLADVCFDTPIWEPPEEFDRAARGQQFLEIPYWGSAAPVALANQGHPPGNRRGPPVGAVGNV